ncbi:MAG: glycosyltransferase family 2 protein [Agathobacter sp.]|nr:glycosyltransferase family 2 protein [Agathobacter sp.]
MEILAGITLYEPDVHRLLENIEAILPQVDKLICVDNGSKNINEIKDRIQWKYPDVDIIENEENLGIAKALNQIFEYAEEYVYDWVLTLDQDSVCPSNLMEEYKKYIDIRDVGVLSPKMVDRNFEKEMKTEKPYDYIDRCITSASLTSVDTWKKVNGFWEYLFIDFVDHDFCAKCKKLRIKIMRVNSVTLLHELGNGEHHTFLGRRVTALNHSPFRKYYMVRNWLIYMHEHREVIDYKKERNSYQFFYLKTLLFEEKKMEKLVQMLKGRRDGKRFIKNNL